MTEPLGQAKFCSVIGFGYKDAELPRIKFQVENGKIVDSAMVQAGDTTAYKWDLRATPEQWEEWRKDPLTIMSLGPAVAQGKIQFKAGDYRAMIRQMQLAKPFLHFFTIL
jgi:hypothetical protein